MTSQYKGTTYNITKTKKKIWLLNKYTGKEGLEPPLTVLKTIILTIELFSLILIYVNIEFYIKYNEINKCYKYCKSANKKIKVTLGIISLNYF